MKMTDLILVNFVKNLLLLLMKKKIELRKILKEGRWDELKKKVIE
jgi:hypothetical protein